MATEPDDRVVFAVHAGLEAPVGPLPQGAHDLSLPAHVGRRVGEHRPRPELDEALALALQPCPQRATQSVLAASTAAYSACASGTTSRGVGRVDARRSATRSSRGRSMSWPIADTTGVVAAATARRRASLLKGRGGRGSRHRAR